MAGLGSNRELAGNKLILLYLIFKMNIPVSNLHLTKVILENRFMNYFFLQQFLTELCDDKDILCSLVDGKSLYTITDSGKQTLGYLTGLIPPGIKRRIDSTISCIRKNVKNETHITADYIPESENEYIVECKVKEDNFSLINLKITVGSKNDARTVCDNWKKHSPAIYAEIIDSVIKNRN